MDHVHWLDVAFFGMLALIGVLWLVLVWSQRKE